MGVARATVTIHLETGFEAPCDGGGALVFGGSVEIEAGFELLEKVVQQDQVIRVTTAIGDRDGARWEAEEILKAEDLFHAAVRQPVRSHADEEPDPRVSRRTLVEDATFYCDDRDDALVLVWRRTASELGEADLLAYRLRMKYFSAAVSLEEESWMERQTHRVLVRSHVGASPIGGGPDFLELMPVSAPVNLGYLIWQDAYAPWEEEPGRMFWARRRYPRMPILRRGSGTFKPNERIVHRPGR